MARVAVGERAMARLPLDRHGRIVPWFVSWIDGTPDHRIARTDRYHEAIRYRVCWVCGELVGQYMSFVIGPMCAVNRVTSEPHCHTECATYSATACPFLSTPTMQRRERRLPDDTTDPGGVMVLRNPGVACVWTTRTYKLIDPGNGGPLFSLGDPTCVKWYAHGRPATRAEVLVSVESGLPLLREAAAIDGPGAMAQLSTMLAAVMPLLPDAA